MTIHTKRVYETPAPSDGVRVLVDRLWPRGLTKEKAKVDIWMKDIAPSNGLRKKYHKQQELWEEFKQHYFAELDRNADALTSLRELLKKGNVTLLFGSANTERNNAAALVEYLSR